MSENIFFHDHGVTEFKGDGVDTCILCGRRVGANARSIHLVGGGARLVDVSVDYDDGPAELGWHSIGPECAKKFPKNFVATLDTDAQI